MIVVICTMKKNHKVDKSRDDQCNHFRNLSICMLLELHVLSQCTCKHYFTAAIEEKCYFCYQVLSVNYVVSPARSLIPIMHCSNYVSRWK